MADGRVHLVNKTGGEECMHVYVCVYIEEGFCEMCVTAAVTALVSYHMYSLLMCAFFSIL